MWSRWRNGRGAVVSGAFISGLALSVASEAKPPKSGAQERVLVEVPLVGCASDGAEGPLPPPSNSKEAPRLEAKYASLLAYYEAQHMRGILAPRGWHCFAESGVDASLFLVAEKEFKFDESGSPVVDGKAGFWGAAIQQRIEFSFGGLRGSVARTVKRAFPKHQDFVKGLIAGGWAEKDLSSPTYAGDRMSYVTDDITEFTTPARAKGLGTESWLQPNDQLIHGAIVYVPSDEGPAIFETVVRLPPSVAQLAPVILKDAEHAN